jgi:hypothetical protein
MIFGFQERHRQGFTVSTFPAQSNSQLTKTSTDGGLVGCAAEISLP